MRIKKIVQVLLIALMGSALGDVAAMEAAAPAGAGTVAQAHICHCRFCPNIHCATRRGHMQCLQYYIENEKVCVNSKCLNSDLCLYALSGSTPIMLAVESCNEEAVNYLLQNGADPTLYSDSGKTVLHALMCGEVCRKDQDLTTRIMRKLLEKLGKEQAKVLCCKTTKDHLSTPLHYAVPADVNECVELLLNAGVPIDAQDNQGQTALYLATEMRPGYDGSLPYGSGGNVECVRLLLDRGANPFLKALVNNVPMTAYERAKKIYDMDPVAFGARAQAGIPSTLIVEMLKNAEAAWRAKSVAATSDDGDDN